MTGNKFHKDKLFAKISHTATSGVVGTAEYESLGEVKLSVATTFATSGTLTVQGRIKHSSSWQTIGTLTSGGDFDTFDIDAYDFIRFNFTVAAGSTGEIAASGFFKAAASGGATNTFATIQTDAGTNPVADSATDTLTLTSSDASITITGNSTTDTVDITLAGGGGDVSGPSSSVDNAIVRFDGTTGKLIQDYTSNAPTISDAGVASFPESAYANAERIGALSAITGDNGTAFGYQATATQESVSIGKNAQCTTSRSQVAIGLNALASGFGATAIGAGADATGSNSFAIGTNTFSSGTYSFALGNGSDALANYAVAMVNAYVSHAYSMAIGRDATSTKTYEFIIGAELQAIKDFSFGCNVTGAAAAYLGDQSFHFINAKVGETDVSCNDVYFKAPTGTGTGTGGHFIFQTAAAGTTGTAQNSYTTHLEITDDGNVIMANLPTSAAGLPTGALWNNSGVINIA